MIINSKKRPNIIGISETNNVNGKAIPIIPGYRVAHNDALIGARGTAIYTKQELEIGSYPSEYNSKIQEIDIQELSYKTM